MSEQANMPVAFGALLAGGLLLQKGLKAISGGFSSAGSASPDSSGATAGSVSSGAAVGVLAEPLAKLGAIIGRPFQGTHTLFGNWQSDNAVDFAAPVGTPVFAVADGVIGNQIGALDSGNPLLQGLRVNLSTMSGNAVYYAHLSRITVHAGQQVKAGDIIGYSGAANGVEHLHIALKNGNPLDVFAGGK